MWLRSGDCGGQSRTPRSSLVFSSCVKALRCPGSLSSCTMNPPPHRSNQSVELVSEERSSASVWRHLPARFTVAVNHHSLSWSLVLVLVLHPAEIVLPVYQASCSSALLNTVLWSSNLRTWVDLVCNMALQVKRTPHAGCSGWGSGFRAFVARCKSWPP